MVICGALPIGRAYLVEKEGVTGWAGLMRGLTGRLTELTDLIVARRRRGSHGSVKTRTGSPKRGRGGPV